MKIAHVIPSTFGDDGVVGGAERYAFELARSMADREDTTLLAFGEVSAQRQHGNLKIRVIGGATWVRGQRSNPIALRLFGELTEFDVIHFHQQHILASSLGAIFCRCLRKTVVVSDLGGGGWDLSGYVSTDRLFHRHLHISKYSREAFGHAHFDRAEVIYGGIDTEKFSPGLEPQDRDRIVYVGRLLPHKGIRYLIEGIPPEIPLDIIGRPYDDQHFQHLVQLAKGKKVRFLTTASDADVVEAYRRAMCVVLPSVYETDEYKTNTPELLGQTLLEGMACGAAGIATNVASLPEVVEDGVSGILVEPNNAEALRLAIVELVENQERHRQMCLAARERVLAKFQWAGVVEACLKAYLR